MIAGYLPTNALISVVENRRPERVLLRRFQQPQKFLDYLSANYITISTLPVEEFKSKVGEPPVRQYIVRSPSVNAPE